MRPSITRAELQELAHLRLQEAESLFHAGLFDGCCYLRGYVLEMALKACVCRHLGLPEYLAPEVKEDKLKAAFKTHEFPSLVLLAGLRNDLERRKQLSPGFRVNWSLCEAWRVDERYQTGKTVQEARDRLDALTDAQEGVRTWLSTRW